MIKANGYWYATYRCADKRLRYSTKIKVENKTKTAELRLARIDKLILQYVERHKILELPVLEKEIRTFLDSQLSNKKAKATPTFFTDYQQMIEDMRSGVLLKKDGNRYAEGAIEPCENAKRAFQRFEAATGFKFTYQMTHDDYMAYIRWLNEQNYSRNTIAWTITYLAGFFSKMYTAKKHTNEAYKQWSYSGEESDTVYVSVEELTNLLNLDIKGAQERARDVFIFASWVALRAKDLARINEYERVGDTFQILTSKTKKKVVIPIHWMADRIYKKYNGVLPVYTTSEGLSYHLPELCKMAGMTQRRLSVITKGGVKIEEYHNKYDMISAHTARRNFATNMYLAGFPVRAIMKVTGHSTEKSFFKYIRIDNEENAQMMLAHPFLKEPVESSSSPSAE